MIIKIVKQIYCKHQWGTMRTNGYKNFYRCEECGKVHNVIDICRACGLYPTPDEEYNSKFHMHKKCIGMETIVEEGKNDRH